MKLGDTMLSVSSKVSTMNKREVSETDLYLLGNAINFNAIIISITSCREALN